MKGQKAPLWISLWMCMTLSWNVFLHPNVDVLISDADIFAGANRYVPPPPPTSLDVGRLPPPPPLPPPLAKLWTEQSPVEKYPCRFDNSPPMRLPVGPTNIFFHLKISDMYLRGCPIGGWGATCLYYPPRGDVTEPSYSSWYGIPTSTSTTPSKRNDHSLCAGSRPRS